MKQAVRKVLRQDKKHFTLPNMISFSRLLFLPFIMHFLTLGTRQADLIVIVLLILSALTDFFDGYVARKLNMTSNLGRMLDPVIDKLHIGIVMIFLAIFKALPAWYVLAVIVRDLLILVASIKIISRSGFIGESNLLGKYTLNSFILVIVFHVIGNDFFCLIALYTSTLLIPISLYTYFSLYSDLLFRNKPIKTSSTKSENIS